MWLILDNSHILTAKYIISHGSTRKKVFIIQKHEQHNHTHYDVIIKQYLSGRIEFIKYSQAIHSKLKRPEKIDPEYKPEEEAPQKPQLSIKKDKEYLPEIRSDSKHRSFTTLIDYALQNAPDFKTFITITFAKNITDLTQANKRFNSFITSIKRKCPDFKYLGVPEFQKRGAVHYHMMTNLKIDSNLIQLQNNDTGHYMVKHWKHGFSTVFDLSLTDENFSVAAYLTKYFFKDIDNRLFDRKKILKSQNLIKPAIFKFTENSQELANYLKYLEKYKYMTKTKHILSTKEYAPNKTIYTFHSKIIPESQK